MMGGGLASLEGGRMEVPRQATVPKPMSASVSHPLEQRRIKKGRELKIGKLGGVWKSKRPDTFWSPNQVEMVLEEYEVYNPIPLIVSSSVGGLLCWLSSQLHCTRWVLSCHSWHHQHPTPALPQTGGYSRKNSDSEVRQVRVHIFALTRCTMSGKLLNLSEALSSFSKWNHAYIIEWLKWDKHEARVCRIFAFLLWMMCTATELGTEKTLSTW